MFNLKNSYKMPVVNWQILVSEMKSNPPWTGDCYISLQLVLWNNRDHSDFMEIKSPPLSEFNDSSE